MLRCMFWKNVGCLLYDQDDGFRAKVTFPKYSAIPPASELFWEAPVVATAAQSYHLLISFDPSGISAEKEKYLRDVAAGDRHPACGGYQEEGSHDGHRPPVQGRNIRRCAARAEPTLKRVPKESQIANS